MVVLLLNRTTNGAGTAFALEDPYVGDTKLQATVYVDPASVFAGATAQIEVSLDNVKWHAVPNHAYTAVVAPARVEVEANFVRARVSGATGATNITVRLASQTIPTAA